MTLRDRAGEIAGWAASPFFAAVGLARHARALHAEGTVLAASVEPAGTSADTAAVGERLRGPALVRFSSALWRHGRQWPDVLGCAVRFRSSEAPSAEPAPGDQDLLFATVRSPFTLWLGPVGTHVRDFLANTYFATAPFDVPGVGRVKWRLVPESSGVAGGDRAHRLSVAIARGDATLRLEMRHTFRGPWAPVARIRLERVVRLDQEALRFWPFRSGRGIIPRGFVHGLRRGAYRSSQMTGHASAS
jgi:hypothetical protein